MATCGVRGQVPKATEKQPAGARQICRSLHTGPVSRCGHMVSPFLVAIESGNQRKVPFVVASLFQDQPS